MRVPLAACFAVLVMAVPASAATLSGNVRRGGEEVDGTPFGTVKYQAARGELNRLVVKEVGGRVVFSDSGAVIRVRGDCKRITLHRARCPFSEDRPVARLGDRADRARLEIEYGPEIFGGEGRDVITGGSGSDELHGDGGADLLRGRGGGDDIYAGGGPDRLYGGRGGDTLYDDRPDGPTSGDVFDGGPDGILADTVDYSKRTRPLNLDLSRKRVNNSKEGDRISGMEGLQGGKGDDRLSGNSRENSIDGGPGDDVINGRGRFDYLKGREGNDRLFGGGGGDNMAGDEGRDSLSGGDGNDLLHSTDHFDGDSNADKAADDVQCGSGSRDSLDGGPRDTAAADCEFADLWDGAISMRMQPKVTGAEAVFSTTCTPESGDACGGTIELRGPRGTVYGSAVFALIDNDDLPDGQRQDLSVPLTTEGQSALAEGAMVVVALEPDDSTVYEPVTAGYRAFMKE